MSNTTRSQRYGREARKRSTCSLPGACEFQADFQDGTTPVWQSDPHLQHVYLWPFGYPVDVVVRMRDTRLGLLFEDTVQVVVYP